MTIVCTHDGTSLQNPEAVPGLWGKLPSSSHTFYTRLWWCPKCHRLYTFRNGVILGECYCTPERVFVCQNCGKVLGRSALIPFEQIKDLHERVGPGEVVPFGECPDCGALCHPVSDSGGASEK